MSEKEDRDRETHFLEICAMIWGEGWAEGAAQVAHEYELLDKIPESTKEMPKQIQTRKKLLEESLSHYRGRIESKAQELIDKGLPQNVIAAELDRFAQGLADERAAVIASTEFAVGRNKGAQSLMDESGMEYEIRFPHFGLNFGEKEECEICESMREGSPYTVAEAEDLGFPDFPHPGCDHGFVFVPVGDLTQTEKFPPG